MILDYHESPLKRRFKAVLTKPHQPFFLLGVTVALLAIFVLGFALRGTLAVDIKPYHAFNMAILMPTALFLGFLFTVLYRFLLVMPFLQKEYMRVFWLLLAGAMLSNVGFFTFAALLMSGIILTFVAQILALGIFIKAYASSNIKDKLEIFWILSAFSFGGFATLFFGVSQIYPKLEPLAVNIAFYPFAVGVVFLIAQKMVPNFFILYFGVTAPTKNNALPGVVLLSLIAVAIFRSFDLPLLVFAANLLGAIALTMIFLENRFIFRKAPPVLWVLQLASVWFFIGFLVGLSELVLIVPPLLQIHIWGVGFIATMMVGFGSRVAMGHSGRKIAADRLTSFIFAAFALLTIVRIAGVFFAPFLEASVYFWCIIFGIWIYKYTPMLISD
jgi:uncharacterized protein involved in response to NO